jgi:hypothetical protein
MTPTPTGTLRPAVRAEHAAVGRLGALRPGGTHPDFDPALFIAAAARTAEGYVEFLALEMVLPNMMLLVARRDAAVIGYTLQAAEGHGEWSGRGWRGGPWRRRKGSG